MIENRNFKVDLGGVLEILSKNLYSSPKVFIRELMQNAVDAITARKAADKVPEYYGKGAVHVELYGSPNSVEPPKLMVTDDGIGLTESEIHEFLSVIGKSSKRMEQARYSFVGQFGIGLLSCFMVCDEIVAVTRSADADKSYEWRGRSNGTYSVKEIDNKSQIGTSIFLIANEKGRNFFDRHTILKLLQYYADRLKVPIYFQAEGGERHLISQKTFPVDHEGKASGEAQEAVLAFGKKHLKEKFIYGFHFDSPDFDTSGLIYFSRQYQRRRNYSKIYLKGMMLSDKVEEILPGWAFFCRVLIDTNYLTPTASREEIYNDERLKKLRNYLGKLVKERFVWLAEKYPEVIYSVVSAHSRDVMRVATEDERLYAIILPHIKLETTEGRLSLEEYVRYSKKILYVKSLEDFRKINYVKDSLNQPVINGGYSNVPEFLSMITSIHPEVKVQQVTTEDIMATTEQLTPAEEENVRFLLEHAEQVLRNYGGKIAFRKLANKDMPVFYSNNKNRRSIMVSSQLRAAMEGKANTTELFTLYLNYNNALVKKMSNIGSYEELKDMSELLYVYALLLGQYPLQSIHKELLTKNMIKLMEMGLNNK